MNPDIHIRRATQADADILAGFQQAMAMETEQKELPSQVVTSGVRRLMQRPELGFYVVAEKDGEVAASLLITFEWTDWRDGLFWWIQSVYVRPAFRRQGIYASMYQWIKEQTALDNDVRGLRLYVEKSNSPAQKTYENLGMKRCDYDMFEAVEKGN